MQHVLLTYEVMIAQLLLGFIEINISDHKCGKCYFSTLAELNKMGFRAEPHLRQRTELKHTSLTRPSINGAEG